MKVRTGSAGNQLLLLLLSLTFSVLSQAQPMDAKLNMAMRDLAAIESSLTSLRPGDVAQYNRLSEKLTKAANLLQSSESKAHPQFQASAQKWSELRELMAATAQQWQSNQAAANQTNSPSPSRNNSLPQTNNPAGATTTIDPEAILAKYQAQNRPTLPGSPNPSEVETWAHKMQALQTTELQNDLQSLQQSNIAPADASRVKRWISGNFQDQITQELSGTMQRFAGEVQTALQLAERLLAIDPADKMRIYNFAQGENGSNNAQILQNGLTASANSAAMSRIFPVLAPSSSPQQIARIATAQETLNIYAEQSQQTQQELAQLPKKQPSQKKEFLKGIAQKLWYRGSEIASLDRKGSIWMNSRDVGDVTSNGTIWVNGNDLGSIEQDGKVWFRGNHIGTLEDNGKVWRNGTQIGLIEPDGKVWIDGNKNGEIVPFEGEWKRAAVVYFFRDIFTQ